MTMTKTAVAPPVAARKVHKGQEEALGQISVDPSNI